MKCTVSVEKNDIQDYTVCYDWVKSHEGMYEDANGNIFITVVTPDAYVPMYTLTFNKHLYERIVFLMPTEPKKCPQNATYRKVIGRKATIEWTS